jgi:hypothetical protein
MDATVLRKSGWQWRGVVEAEGQGRLLGEARQGRLERRGRGVRGLSLHCKHVNVDGTFPLASCLRRW